MVRLLCYGSFECVLYKYSDYFDDPEDPDTERASSKDRLSRRLLKSGFEKSEHYLVDGLSSAELTRYRTRKREVHQDFIVSFYKNPDVRDFVNPYFAIKITPYMPQERTADFLQELQEIIDADWFIADAQKANFKRLASADTLNEYLAEVFIYAIKQPNIKNKVFQPLLASHNNDLEHRNPNFIGREKQLKQINNYFHDKSNEPIQVIWGLGGVGKTQLALEYAYEFESVYNVIWRLKVETFESALRGARDFTTQQQLFDEDSGDDVVINAFLRWFETKANWLLILDNIEDFNVAYQFLPKKINGHVLITTRLSVIPIGKAMEIDVFTPDVALEFLQKRLKTQLHDTERINAESLAKRLGYFPLALEQAAAYITETPGEDFGSYLSLLEQHGLDILDDAVPTTFYKLTVKATWQISIAKIQMESALQLMNICAYCASDNIFLEWFIKYSYALLEPLQADIADRRMRNRLIKELVRFSLFRYENDSLSLHRLLQEIIREEHQKEYKWVMGCFNLYLTGLIKTNTKTDDRKEIVINAPHALKAAEHMESLIL